LTSATGTGGWKWLWVEGGGGGIAQLRYCCVHVGVHAPPLPYTSHLLAR
jgi:hypothetical protein